MGVAKAALEASVRYLAADLGPDGRPRQRDQRRPGPDAGRGGHRRASRRCTARSPRSTPLRANITPEDVGKTALYLASDLSSAVTGEVIYVDGGFNILGVPTSGS